MVVAAETDARVAASFRSKTRNLSPIFATGLDPTILVAEAFCVLRQPLELRHRVAELNAVRINDIGGDGPIVLPNEKNEVGPDDPWFATILVNDAKQVLAGSRRVPVPRDGSRPREFGFHRLHLPMN